MSHSVKEIQAITKKVRSGSLVLRTMSEKQRNGALVEIIRLFKANKQDIFSASEQDVLKAQQENLASALVKRLVFDEKKLNEVITMIESVITLKDLLYQTIIKRQLADNLILTQRRVPIGVIAMIFESRPDALVQIACLCLKSGNGIILKGGSEAKNTNAVLFNLIKQATAETIVDTNNSAIQWTYLFETREETNALISLPNCVDLIIPRGSAEFVRRIMKESSVPVLGHADGICHAYIHDDADIQMCADIIFDSKLQYTAVCNALECVVIHENALSSLPEIVNALVAQNVILHADTQAGNVLHKNGIAYKEANDSSWGYEYLDKELSIKTVKNIDEAIQFINTHGSGHTDVIISQDKKMADYFQLSVDSSSVLHNCSTRFADGYRYGLGAEVGVSTSRIHARGPVGIEGLLTTQWVVNGNGQTVAPFANGQAKFTHKDI